jgi:hypothetical protein
MHNHGKGKPERRFCAREAAGMMSKPIVQGWALARSKCALAPGFWAGHHQGSDFLPSLPFFRSRRFTPTPAPSEVPAFDLI